MTEQCWFWFVTSFTDLGSAFDGTCTCMYAHVFSKHFCSCSKLPRIKFWILINFCCCYFRAEIMKQMKNLRKQMKKKSFQVNSEWMCSHVYLIIIWTNEQAHYSENTRDFFLFYTHKYVDLFYWTCLYMKDSSVCKWMIHAKGILKWDVELNSWLLYWWEAVS